MPYQVYVNRPNNKAIVHDADCKSLRQHGGISPGNGCYSDVFATLDEACTFALGTNKKEIRPHQVASCLGHLPRDYCRGKVDGYISE